MGKLKQASPAKFYVAKYFFLALGLLQWSVSALLFTTLERTPKNTAVSFLFACLGSIAVVFFFYLQSSMRRVAVSKDKIIVIKRKRNEYIQWPDVKSIRLIPVFNLYKLELKDEDSPIYFFPSKNVEPAYDLLAQDTTKMGEIVSKRKKELGI